MRKIDSKEYAEKYRDRTEPGFEPPLFETEPGDLLLPRRDPVGHKYRFGRALVIAGSAAYTGAPVLAANACERGGAGLTTLMVPRGVHTPAAIRCDGAVVTPLPETERGGLSMEALPRIISALERADACLIGPGLGMDENVRELVRAVIRESPCPLVLDADALNACAGEGELLSACRAPLLLTPHEGEFKRFGGDLTAGRLSGARRFAEQHPGTILILKGFGTLVCRDRETCVNPTGGPAMAKGGSGDVLAGVLCGLLAQGFEPWFAARCAVWLHGLAGDLCARALGEYSVTPSDLIRRLPDAFLCLQKDFG